MKRKLAVILCAMIVGGVFAALGGCKTAASDEAQKESGENPMTSDEPISKSEKEKEEPPRTPDSAGSSDVREAVNSFSAQLFKTRYESDNDKGNKLISPFSVYTALSMLDNGAGGETEKEITDVLSGYFDPYVNGGVACYGEYKPVSLSAINSYFDEYLSGLYDEGVEPSMMMSDSIWAIRNGEVRFKENYFEICGNYYKAELFSEPLNNRTVDKINAWTSGKTSNMIPKIIDGSSVNKDMTAVLLNAVAFNGKWEKEYPSDAVSEREFNNYDGSKSTVKFMRSQEANYLNDGHAVGFVKFYKGKKSDEDPGGADASRSSSNVQYDKPRYAFAALLPNEDIGIDEYIKTYFGSETFSNALNNAENSKVNAYLPKFKFDCSYELKDDLYKIGIRKAFDPLQANFEKMTDSNFFVNEVVHKTYIEVDEKGTKAAAATSVITRFVTSAYDPRKTYTVVLDRPFLFTIYDLEEKIPIFIGTVMTEN